MELTEEQEFIVQVGKAGYERYRKHAENIAVETGSTLPGWDGLPEGAKGAWFEIADGIINFLAKQKLVGGIEENNGNTTTNYCRHVYGLLYGCLFVFHPLLHGVDTMTKNFRIDYASSCFFLDW